MELIIKVNVVIWILILIGYFYMKKQEREMETDWDAINEVDDKECSAIASAELDFTIKLHIDREVHSLVCQYLDWVREGRNPDHFIVMTNPRALFLHITDGAKSKYDLNNINKIIFDEADRQMRGYGYNGYKGYADVLNNLTGTELTLNPDK